MALLIARAAEASGANVETVEQPDWPAYLWPECVPAWDAFLGLQDQWQESVLPRSEVLAHLQFVVADEAERRSIYDGVCACAKSARHVILADRAAKLKKRREEAEAAAARRRH